MKMKLKLLIWSLAILISGALYIMPRMVQSSIPSIYYVTPNHKTYENIVNCNGNIQAVQVKSISVDAPFVPSEVRVAVGDRVEAGELLITVDQERSRQLSLPTLQMLQNYTENTLDTLIPSPEVDASAIDWVALASAYGLSATVTGGPEQYGRQLQGFLSDMGIPATAELLTVPTVTGNIVAPMAGIVTDVTVQKNTAASAGKSLITLTDDTHYKVMAAVSESDIAKVRIGDSANIRGVGFAKTYTGEVVKIYPTARKMISGTTTETVVDVEILLNDPDNKLKPGFTAKVEIIGGDDYDLLTVPYEAIRQDENNDEYVYVYENGKIKKSLVVTGKELTNEVQILDGLDSKSIVVFNPGDIKQEGVMIHIKGRANVD